MTLNKNDLIRQLVNATDLHDKDVDFLHLPGWDLSSWERLLQNAEPVELSDGEVLLRRSDTSNDLCFLVAGELEVSIPRAYSHSFSPLVSIRPGSVVGELSFFDNHGRSASVWSCGKSSLLRLRPDAFEAFKKAHPLQACDLLFAIGRIIAERLRRVEGADFNAGDVYSMCLPKNGSY